MMLFNGFIQDRVVARQQFRHLPGMFLRQPGAAFDIGKEKGDGACWELVLIFHMQQRL